MKSVQYPSLRTVNYSYESNTSRVTDVASNVLGAATPYATGITYAPHGAVACMTMGNNLVESRTYNSRLQPEQVAAGSLLTLDYSYCPPGDECTTNNGNLVYQSIAVPGSSTWYQYFAYDARNRLTQVAEYAAAKVPPDCVTLKLNGQDVGGNCPN